MNNAIARKEYFLKPGYMYITREPHEVYAVLGSCVMVCLWDRIQQTSGACMYKYPSVTESGKTTAQFGNVALSALIRMMMQDGCMRMNIQAMLFGGADRESAPPVGLQNVKVAKKILRKYRIKVISEDVGGSLGRKIIYHASTNQAVIYKVNSLRNMDWYPYGER